MKMTFGGNMTMTIMNKPYEPIKIESVLIIEKEVPDDLDDNGMDQMQNRINTKLREDLNKKILIAADEQTKARKKIKELF